GKSPLSRRGGTVRSQSPLEGKAARPCGRSPTSAPRPGAKAPVSCLQNGARTWLRDGDGTRAGHRRGAVLSIAVASALKPENTVRVWQERRGPVVAPAKPNWGSEDALRGNFVGGGEPKHLRVPAHGDFRLPLHVAQPPLAGRDHQPAPGLIPKALPVRLTAQI